MEKAPYILYKKIELRRNVGGAEVEKQVRNSIFCFCYCSSIVGTEEVCFYGRWRECKMTPGSWGKRLFTKIHILLKD
jgi:hypothetical protein